MTLNGNPTKMDIPRNKFIGQDINSPNKEESEHYMKCKICGGYVDMRDLGIVFQHIGRLPHPSCDSPS